MNLDDLPTPSTQAESYSPLQEAIIDAFVSTDRNILVDAGPGSGKSHTARGLAMSCADDYLMVAFNKAIADENASYGLASSTWHSLGLRALKQKIKRTKVSGYATLNHLVDLGAYTGQYAPDWAWEVSELSTQIRAAGGNIIVDVDEDLLRKVYASKQKWADVDEDLVIEWTMRELEHRDAWAVQTGTIDFADMLYLPHALDCTLPTYDVGIIDEAQDTDPFQLLWATKVFDRTVWVGDPRQSIYAFRGADSNAIGAIKKQFACDEYPLNVTYRCRQAIVDECNIIHPSAQLIAFDIEGYSAVHRTNCSATEADNTLVLCRNNAPLIGAAVTLLKSNQPFTITTDFPDKMVRWIKKMRLPNVAALAARAERALDDRLITAAESDKWETVATLCERHTSLDDLLKTLESLKGLKSLRGPLLSTIHKAKGLEAENVILLKHELLPSKFAQSDEAKAQERNLHFVAVSRAKRNFTYA